MHHAENHPRKPHYLAPFNERARDLRIQNKPLWLHQRLLAPHTNREMELPANARLPQTREPCLVYRDNLFDAPYLEAFLAAALDTAVMRAWMTRLSASIACRFRHPRQATCTWQTCWY